jgi:hypothetical protein
VKADVDCRLSIVEAQTQAQAQAQAFGGLAAAVGQILATVEDGMGCDAMRCDGGP